MMRRRLRRKRLPRLDRSADRAVITVVLLAVTLVLLLVGFSGPSVHLHLPGPTGWLYIGAVAISATVALVWLFCFYERQKGGNPSGLKPVNRRSKRIQLQ